MNYFDPDRRAIPVNERTAEQKKEIEKQFLQQQEELRKKEEAKKLLMKEKRNRIW